MCLPMHPIGMLLATIRKSLHPSISDLHAELRSKARDSKELQSLHARSMYISRRDMLFCRYKNDQHADRMTLAVRSFLVSLEHSLNRKVCFLLFRSFDFTTSLAEALLNRTAHEDVSFDCWHEYNNRSWTDFNSTQPIWEHASHERHFDQAQRGGAAVQGTNSKHLKLVLV